MALVTTVRSIYPQAVVGGVFIGSASEAHDRYNLKSKNITHILTVQIGNYPRYPQEFKYKCIDALDSHLQNLREHFESCFTFIEEAIAQGGGVLVHCGAGVSRSATIVIAYLMKTKQWRYAEARLYLENIRPMIEPNDGFVLQLQAYEKELFDSILCDIPEAPCKND
eukprot:Phypoly_transcript_22102.p1 GENE.Phypoly_transcript_22102~~Phypoly_transcript_22102.p1  ORF type:complete len:167 (-),score=13.12 Phypoly_transcript_22102:74-574(-)